jgi:LPS export ABC transporter protein LptC
MFSGAKHLSYICWPALLAGMLFISACENDLKKVREISSEDVSKQVQTFTGVDVIYSDSAVVKFRILSPLMLKYEGPKPYNEMPKGIDVHIYDKNIKQIGTLTADYAIQDSDGKLLQFRKNVVATNDKGETFKSDELIWDQNTKLMHSSKIVQITMANGDIMNGTGFQSDQTLNHWTINQSTGIFNVTENSAGENPTQ